MLLNELLNRQTPYKIDVDTAESFVTSAMVGGRKITFKAALMMYRNNSMWFVEFSESKDGSETYKASGSGNELEVFSLVVSSMKELVSRHNPDMIRFTASKGEGEIGSTRANLYGRLAQRFKLPEYNLKRTEVGDTFAFELVHVDAQKRAEERAANARPKMSPEEQAQYDAFRRRREMAR